MARTDSELHEECMQRFIELANSMTGEGASKQVVSAGLMTASAVYSTYVFAGNDGRLAGAGVDKVSKAFRQQLEQVQKAKGGRDQANAQ